MLIQLNLFTKAVIVHCSLQSDAKSSRKPVSNPLRKSNSRKPFRSLTPIHLISTDASTDAGLKFREKLLYLESLRVNPIKALQMNPDFRSTPLSVLKSVEKCLSSMGIERSAHGRILDMIPRLLSSDPYTDIYPVFDFLLNDVDIPFHDIRNSIIRCPRLLICGVDGQLRPAFRFLEELGFRGPNKITCQTTVLLVSNVEETLIPKVNYLMGLGFKHEEVSEMVLRSPGLLTFSIENNFRPKVDYFLKEMNGDLMELKEFPQYFSFSLESKIKARHMLLAENGVSLPLREMLKISEAEFNTQMIELQLQLVEKRKI